MNGQSWPPDGLASSALDDTLVTIVYLMKDLLPHAVGNHRSSSPATIRFSLSGQYGPNSGGRACLPRLLSLTVLDEFCTNGISFLILNYCSQTCISCWEGLNHSIHKHLKLLLILFLLLRKCVSLGLLITCQQL